MRRGRPGHVRDNKFEFKSEREPERESIGLAEFVPKQPSEREPEREPD